jgi:anti-sigma factor RsiW
MDHLFAHDGRLSDLTIDRFLTDDLSEEEARQVQAHLLDHPEEQARVTAIRAKVAAPLPPLSSRQPPREGRLSDLTVARLITDDLSDDEVREVQAHLDAHPEEQARVTAIRAKVAAPLPPLSIGIFARDGRLSDLTIDRLITGDLSLREARQVQSHLDARPEEQARVAAIQAEAAAPLPALRSSRRPVLRLVTTPPELKAQAKESEEEETEETPRDVVASPGRRWGVVGTLLAIAAAVMLVVFPSPEDPATPPDAFTLRGGLAMDVVVKGTDTDRLLVSGDRVSLGDKLGFQVSTDSEGYLLILGIDGTGEAYPAYPARGGSAARQAVGSSQSVPAAIELDATPGVERLVAIHCEAPFTYARIAEALEEAMAERAPEEDAGLLREGCRQKELWLQKDAP